MESNPSSTPSVSELLDQLWLKFRPQIEERVVVLERAAAELAQGNLSPALCEEAHHAAHKLAGSLGTFGLIQAGELAREAENLYQAHPGPGSTARLVEIAQTLRTTMNAR